MDAGVKRVGEAGAVSAAVEAAAAAAEAADIMVAFLVVACEEDLERKAEARFRNASGLMQPSLIASLIFARMALRILSRVLCKV